jgi:ribonuclease HI
MPEWIHTLTVDASYDFDTGTTGVGIVVQARGTGSGRGPILEQISEGHFGVPPGAGELFAVLRALEIAGARGFERLQVRCDYNWLRRRLKVRHRAGGAKQGPGGLEREVLHLAARFTWVDFRYVPRRRNQIAHALARRGRTTEVGNEGQ